MRSFGSIIEHLAAVSFGDLHELAEAHATFRWFNAPRVPSAMLQCSRGLMTAESEAHAMTVVVDIAASMQPRSHDRGKDELGRSGGGLS